MKEVLKGIHLLSLGGVNAYLIDHGQLTLIDTGYAGNGEKIIQYIHKIGKREQDLKNIIITHLHTDHTGSLAELTKLTNAQVFAHAADAPLIEQGTSFREALDISPGLFNRLAFHLFVKNAPRTIQAATIDHIIQDGDEQLPIGEGFRIIPVPGHCRGQIALMYPNHGGLLFAADTTGHMLGLGIAPFYEDYVQGMKDIARLSQLSFEVALFGHGKPLLRHASRTFRRKFQRIVEAHSPSLGSKVLL